MVFCIVTDNMTFDRVSDASGELQIDEVAKYPLKMEMLDSKVWKFIQRLWMINEL